MKIGIAIITYNLDCRVFVLQVDAIMNLCKDDYVIEVFDNSTEKEAAKAIKYHCDIRGISYKRTKSGSKNSSDSHCFALKCAFEMMRERYDWFFFLDHDCIPVRKFSVVEVLGLSLMAGIGQGVQKKYLWVGCLMMNLSGLDKNDIDMNYSHEYGLDSGGKLYKVIEKYGMENFNFFDETYCQLDGFAGKYGYYTLINDGMFLHMIGGSNWEKNDRHEERMSALINITNELIAENVD